MKAAILDVRVRFRKFKDAFETFLEDYSLVGLDHLNEGLQDA